MIKAKDGAVGIEVTISGDSIDVLFELSSVIRSFRAMIAEEGGDEIASSMIAFAGELAFAENDEEKTDIVNRFADWINSQDKELMRRVL